MLENPVLDSETSAFDPALSRRALLVGGAIVGAALVLPKLPAQAGEMIYGDMMSLRFLEEVARLEADFFTRASLSSPAEGLSESEASAFNLIARQDSQLARWFDAARRRTNMGAAATFYTPNKSSSWPVRSFAFGAAAFSSRAQLFSMGIMIKETAVGAFHGVVGSARGPEMVQAFASLAGVQGRHLTVLRELAGRDPLVPYEAALSRSAVAQKLQPYGWNRGVME